MLRMFQSSFIKYIVVGGLSLGIDYALLLLLYRLFGFELAVSTTIAFLIAFLVNFLLSKIWSFHAAKGLASSVRQATLYTALVVVNLMFTNFFILLLNTLAVGPEVSKPIVTAIIAIWNYFFYKHFIFKQAEVASN